MRSWLLALAVAAQPALAEDSWQKVVNELEKNLILASYAGSLSHFFELECPNVGAIEFTCTGHRVSVMAMRAGLCRIYTMPKELHFKRTGALKWTDYVPGEPYAEVYELTRIGPLQWELAFHEEKTRDFVAGYSSSSASKYSPIPVTGRRRTPGAAESPA